MRTPTNNPHVNKWLPFILAAILGVTFFLPWVSWQGSAVSGCDLPTGHFFKLSKTKFGLENPMPQLGFAFYAFCWIPVGAVITMILVAISKFHKGNLVAFTTGAVSLALATVFILFTKTLVMLGVGKSVLASLQPAFWLHALSAIALIIITPTSQALLKKIIWLLIGPVFVFIGFKLVENKVMGEKFGSTNDVKADYTVTASALLQEFEANDSLANAKYKEKIVEVSGPVSEVEMQADSTANMKFVDSTGSYIIFSFDKDQYEQTKNIKAGEEVSLKGSCSGSVYSDILSTTSISFKRSIINKK